MMARQRRDQAKLFYEFRLDERIPQSHLLRQIDVLVTAALADLHQELEPYYSSLSGVQPLCAARGLARG